MYSVPAFTKSKGGFDCALSVTCKFSKRATLIPGKGLWNAKQWAEVLLERLWIADWGLPKVILSARDRKFLSQLWSGIFERLGVELLYSTAYHPQTDGQSERTNQTVETMLRFFLATLEDPTEWPHCLPRIQSVLNNAPALSSAGRMPNEIAYGFTLNLARQLVMLEAGLEQGLEQELGLAILRPILQQRSMPQPQLD